MNVESPDGMATTVPQLRLLVPPDPKEARAVRERVAAFVRALGATEEVLLDFITIIGEAFANAVQHAHTSDAIEISTWCENGGRLLARVVDRGCGFACGEHPEPPSEPAESLRDSGRGLWIMNCCADTLSVDSLPGLGTAIVFARNIR